MSNSSTPRRLIQPAILSLLVLFGSCALDQSGHYPPQAVAQDPAPQPVPVPLPAPVDPAEAFDAVEIPDSLEDGDWVFIDASKAKASRVKLNVGPPAAYKAAKVKIQDVREGVWMFGFGKNAQGRVVLVLTGLVGGEPVSRIHEVTVGSTPAPTPTPAPVPVPVVPDPTPDMQAKVAPVKALLATADPAKKAILANVWADFAAALQASTPPSIGAFKQAMQQFISAAVIRAGLTNAFPGYTAALDQSFVLTFGDQDGQLDSAKAVAWAQALSWACK